MIVLGIDPGSHHVGYAFLEQEAPGKRIHILEYGAIHAKATDDLMARLSLICKEIETRIHLYKPELLAMESSFYSKNARTALVLGHARGAIMAVASRTAMSYQEASPRSIKQAVTGSGAASKERVSIMMQHHLGLTQPPEPADASDALAVAWNCLNPLPIHAMIAHNTPKQIQPPKNDVVKIGSRTNAVNAVAPGTDLTSLLALARKRKRR